mmetsp:Transcript_31499/g.51104  ORF Transcript_31499/g.51104 Transcript_31499/m.51104 type:complete len:101 (+) Transcript_31499:107-409(+)
MEQCDDTTGATQPAAGKQKAEETPVALLKCAWTSAMRSKKGKAPERERVHKIEDAKELVPSIDATASHTTPHRIPKLHVCLLQICCILVPLQTMRVRGPT